MAATKEKIAIIGSGNWGSAIARIIGFNAARHDDIETEVNMWVFEEMIEGKKLSEIINETHENVKYLKGVKLPENVIAEPDLAKAVTGATLLVFVMPHQFLPRTVPNMKAMYAANARGVSLIKGIEFEHGKPQLISELISKTMGGMDISVLMGANVANEVAQDQFCESTVGATSPETGDVWKKVFDWSTFRVNVVGDVPGVELCGALKNVVAIGAGFCDGLEYGGNTKAAIIRVGLEEMMRFVKYFYKSENAATYFESCGVADLITTCFGGRNRKCAEIFAKHKGAKSWDEIEVEQLDGQKLQGTITAKDVMTCLKTEGVEAMFPLFCKIYMIAFENVPVEEIVSF
ncbi:glycerol3phosphate dehydrogenase putative [Pavlovales sp. CCMP2436]|nr:glycerol3phosphate dehydrogenase putative [Pavlovales sp. CCMP2436]|mmetsp:Transcript_7475/g.19416  ORF Transcript_7475/g.19416 Transcript_7475/m.19416 type:complete len:346 (+) Transcript_7475:118-1155(+)